MKKFHFAHIYFKKNVYDDEETRIVVTEKPSLNITEEDYSLRVETRHEKVKIIHREYAIEHHRKIRHTLPHLQFHFYTEEIGKFWINLEFKDDKEYEQAILGFIYKIKNVIDSLNNDIAKEILNTDLIADLKKYSTFLDKKISESIAKQLVEFQIPEMRGKILDNPLLLDFLGKYNATKISS